MSRTLSGGDSCKMQNCRSSGVLSHFQRILSFCERHALALILILALALRLLYLFDWHDVWWDGAVYVGMGKFIWSLGAAGLWEDIRPVLWPIVLGFFWKIGINPVVAARALMLLLSLGVVFLTFRVSDTIFGRRAAIVASLLTAFSPIIFFMGFHEYTEIPSLFLTLAGVILFLRSKDFWSGFVIGLAFLTRFPAALFGILLGAVVLLKREWTRAFHLLAGFASATIAFFAANWFFYGNPLHMVLRGQSVISEVLGCTVLRYRPWHDYLSLLLSENFINAFAVVGVLYVVLGQSRTRQWVILGCALLPLAYLMALPCRDYRYLVNVLPFVSMIAAAGSIWALSRVSKKWQRTAFALLAVFVLVLGVWNARGFYVGNENRVPVTAAEEYYSFLLDKHPQGEVWVSNPIMAAHTDLSLHKLYYPVYGEDAARYFAGYVETHAQNISYVAMDNCGGGIICSPGDVACEKASEQVFSLLKERFKVVYNASAGRCEYVIYGTGNKI